MNSSHVVKREDRENYIHSKNHEVQSLGCASPNTLSCVDILMGMKNGQDPVGKKTKRPLLVLTESNVPTDEEVWYPSVTSPLKLAISLSGTTSFRFCDTKDHEMLPQESNSLPTTSGELLSYNSNASIASCSSLSSFGTSSIKRSDSNDAIFPVSKTFHLLSHPHISPSFTSFLESVSQDVSDGVKSNEAALRSLVRKVDTNTSVRLAVSSSNHLSGCTVCNCRRSHCLKLYCACFKNRGFCSSDCNCLSCFNNTRHEEEREETIQQMLTRNPHCFESHVDRKKGINRSGCRCRKTHCDKKYCECFNFGIPCGDQCQCTDCKNQGPHSDYSI